ncbi:MAG: DNA-processing protein DprA [Defluviitaleaceae bacterium]|nr:DNA-processing protein DprA [Defluviitaleaceae bacterium]MCL2836074.1 DNA-processing protein DprA [Defluviitaleaceae bacterium]
MNETAYMLWLAGTQEVGRKAALGLCEIYGPEELWNMPENRLLMLPQLHGKAANRLLQRRNERAVVSELEGLSKKGIWLLTYGGADYPGGLKDIDDPPLLLYGLGTMPPESMPRVAVIGARKCSSYGLSVAKKIAYGLAGAGFAIVSGLARGIDCQAHVSAIDAVTEANGEESARPVTIAVLGCGVDVCYPPENYSQYKRILNHGCVLSEYPPGTAPSKYMFPQRNRIISGLSLGIVVVEAAERSGTGTTVNMALAQGREVFVVPGSILSHLSAGTNNMIKDGAIPVTSHEDVVWALRRELGHDFFGSALNAHETGNGEHNIKHNLTKEEKTMLNALSTEPVDVDALAASTGIAAQDVMFFMSKLELAGLVKPVRGLGYVKTYS